MAIIEFALLTPVWTLLVFWLLRFINLFADIFPKKISSSLYVEETTSDDLADYAMWLEQ